MDEFNGTANNEDGVKPKCKISTHAADDFGIWLPLHCYICSGLFILAGVIAFVLIIRVHIHQKKHAYIVVIDYLVILLAVMRACYLLIDPYNALGIVPPIAVQFFEDLAIPMLTSAFTIVIWVIYTVCSLGAARRSGHKLRSLWFLVAIVITHILFVISIDIAIVLTPTVCWIVVFCQGLSAIYGLVLCVTVFAMLLRAMRTRDSTAAARRASVQSQNGMGRSADGLPLKFKMVTCASMVLGFLSFSLSVIAIGLITNPYHIDFHLDKWGWLAFQTAQRLVEVFFAYTLLYLAWDGNGRSQRSTTTNVMRARFQTSDRRASNQATGNSQQTNIAIAPPINMTELNNT